MIQDWRDIAQILVNGLMTGSMLMLPAIGFTTIFAVLRYPNFAIAGYATVGAFAGWIANTQWGLPAGLALFAAFAAAGALGLLAEETALKPLRPSGALTVAIASVALTLLIENVVRFFFGNDLKGYDLPIMRDWRFDGIRVGPQQLQNTLYAIGAAGALFALLAFTRLGRAMRAVADNPQLADIKGVDPDRIARVAVFIGAGLAGFGGMLLGLDTSIDPLTGFRVVLSVFAAAVVGGLGSIPGAALGALVVGIGEEMAGVLLEPAYRTVTAFLAILVVLSIRPQGLLGQGRLMDAYIVAMLVFAGFYALMALGLNVIWGLAGMVNLGLVGFFGLGAYASALLTTKLFWPMPLGWAAGAAVAAAAGAMMALIVARLRGDYLAIVTLGFAEVIRLVASNEIWLTNGTDGISGIPGPWRGEVSPQGFNLIFLALVWVAVGIAFLLCARLSHSPFGRVLRAIREDEDVAAVAGKPVLWFKIRAFALGAAVVGFSGALYAHYNAYIAPDGFAPLLTIYVVLALTAGGVGAMRGAVIGAVLVLVLLEGTRFLAAAVPGLAPVQKAALRESIIALSLILLLRFRPQGLIPERTRTHSSPGASR